MSDSEDQDVFTLRLPDGTEVTFRTRQGSQQTVGEALEAMGEEARELFQRLIEVSGTVSSMDPPDASAADAIAAFGELPDPRDVPMAVTISDLPESSIPYTPQESNTSACPWCGHPITLSRTPGAGS